MLTEIRFEDQLPPGEIETNALRSVSGNLIVQDIFNNDDWLLNEDFPVGFFPVRFNKAYKFAFIKFKDNVGAIKWKKAKLSRIYFALNQFPNGLTTEVKKHSRLISTKCIELADIETILIQKLRHDFDRYVTPGSYKYDEAKMELTGEAAWQNFGDISHLSFKHKDGIFFPFIGYDSDDNVVCLLFHFKSNSAVIEGK